MISRRRIAVISGSRSDYSFLKWVLRSINMDERIDGQLIVTGMHLESHQGQTLEEVTSDGVIPWAAVPVFDHDAENHLYTASSLSRGINGISEVLGRLAPDIVVILGDRLEALAAALASHALGIPIAHIHGGEVTVGARDDAYRHCISKLSALHFPCTEVYRTRLLQLGEEPRRVLQVGALAVEAIDAIVPQSKMEIVETFGLTEDLPLLVMSFHPETCDPHWGKDRLVSLLLVLSERSDLQIVSTAPNSDPGGREMGAMIKHHAQRHAHRWKFVPSLGQARYVNLLRVSDLLIGNSSSAFFEGAILGTPAIDIGARQEGRMRTRNSFHVDGTREAIEAAIDIVMSTSRACKETWTHSDFGDGQTSRRIANALATFDLESLGPKRFSDLESGKLTDPS